MNLNDEQKTRLLEIGLDSGTPAAPIAEDDEKGDLLYDILRCPLPTDAPAQGPLPPGTKPYRGFRTVSGPPLSELLQDPKTDIAILRQIKDYAKKLGANTDSQVEKDVFLAMYFAAIAGAIEFHDECITEHSPEDLLQFISTFADAEWIPADLTELFKKALRRYQERRQMNDDSKE